MGIFGPNKNVEGEIDYYKLNDWWLDNFDEHQREYIIERYQPMGASPRSLVEGKIDYSSATLASFLTGLGSWFVGPNDRAIGRTILEKARQEAALASDVLGMHFTLSSLITLYYRDRDKVEGFYDKAIECCESQIAMQSEAAQEFKSQYPHQELPSHAGYDQLAIILEKAKEFDRAIKLCLDAKANGWSGDWDKRITRCKAKSLKNS